MFKHVLIPTDGSRLSMKAVESGVAFAKSLGAKVTVVTVIEPSGVVGTDSRRVAETRKAYEEHVRENAERELKDAERTAREKGRALHDDPAGGRQAVSGDHRHGDQEEM